MRHDMQKRYVILKEQILRACQSNKRDSSDVHLLAVSKGHNLDQIRTLYQMGQHDFGENYAEELERKKKAFLEECPLIRWHFIGQIQTNKAKKIASADVVHSVASQKQALALAKYRLVANPLSVFLQVNLDGNMHRGGAALSDLEILCRQIQDIKELHLCGLMAILPLITEKDPELGFRQVVQIKSELEVQIGIKLPELSMGMSQDFAVAIACGATWIRIGTALFGDRNK